MKKFIAPLPHCRIASLLVGHVRHERQLARALDGLLDRALMRGAGAGNPPRLDLAALGDERRQHLDVLVADVVDLLDAELADPPAPEKRAPRALVLVVLLGAAAAALLFVVAHRSPLSGRKPISGMSKSSSSCTRRCSSV